jgi:hypothetical protein
MSMVVKTKKVRITVLRSIRGHRVAVFVLRFDRGIVRVEEAQEGLFVDGLLAGALADGVVDRLVPVAAICIGGDRRRRQFFHF